MEKYHITSSGDVRGCKAKIKCPLGDESLHFETPEEARAAFEEMMSPLAANLKRSLKSLDADGLRVTLFAESKSAGMDVEKIRKASEFATLLHEGQYRAAAPGEARPPYITHPLRNSIRAIRWGAQDTDQVLIGLFHDIVEDSSLRYVELEAIEVKDEAEAREVLLDRIRKEYGNRVASGVLKLSNPLEDPAVKAAKTIEERHESYAYHVGQAIKNDEDAFLLKLSDLHDNAAGLYHTDFESRKAQTRKQAKKYLHTVPRLKQALELHPFTNEKIQAAAVDSVNLIEARLRWMLAKDE